MKDNGDNKNDGSNINYNGSIRFEKSEYNISIIISRTSIPGCQRSELFST